MAREVVKKDWEAEFKDFKKCLFQSITDYIDEVKPEYADTLAKQIEEGKNYISIKTAFYNEFFPQFKPESKENSKMAKWLKARAAK